MQDSRIGGARSVRRSRRSVAVVTALAVLAALMSFSATPVGAQDDDEVISITLPLVLAEPEATWTSTTIPVCWENPRSDNAAGRRWSQEAVEGTWEAVSDVDFTGWDACNVSSRGVRILIDDDGPHVKALGSDLDGRRNGMVLNFTFQEWSSDCAATLEACIRPIAVHEFGHALGFSHEHNRDDRRRCGDSPQGTNGTVYLTDYDPESVMNYCSSDWFNDRLTALDVAGVRSVYGPFSAEVPVRVVGEVAIWIKDHETWPFSDEIDSDEFPFEFILGSSAPQIQNFSYCVGDEVRVEVELRAALLPVQARTQFTARSVMYEGGSCNTTDREDTDTATESITMTPTSSGDIAQRLLNGGLAGGDEAKVDISFIPTMVDNLTRVQADGCRTCESAAEASTFGEDRLILLPGDWIIDDLIIGDFPVEVTIEDVFPDAVTIDDLIISDLIPDDVTIEDLLPDGVTIDDLINGDVLPGDFIDGDLIPDVIVAAPTCRGLAVTVNIADGDVPTEGDDVILGTPGNDVINALGGDDLICASGGDDTVRGGDGKDKIFGGNGDDTLLGGAMRDRIYGGAGEDDISGHGGWDLIWGGSGPDRINGGYGKDVIRGAAGDDVILGGYGPDELRGGGGNDRLVGENGRDLLIGGSGDDVLRGGNGKDTLRGLSGDDAMNGNGGVDSCTGGAGLDSALRCETVLSVP